MTTEPHCYLSSSGWLAEIGECHIKTVERWQAGEVAERRALFENGIDVDFIVLAADDIRQAFQDTPVGDIARRGARILLDKDGLLSSVVALVPNGDPSRPPTPAQFTEVLDDFWFHAVWTAKKLRRGELWTAKWCCDVHMKGLLLSMLEWHTGATEGWEMDTWFSGRFLERWASPSALAELPHTFAHYDEDDVWRALFATMALFRRVAQETAGALEYDYPQDEDQHALAWVVRYRSG